MGKPYRGRPRFKPRDGMSWDSFLRAMRNLGRKPPEGGHLMPEPVEPDPRRPLSGGAEAPLEFDD